ncbi:hypothetical protein ACQP2T_14030 [Nonomuraea sp. CA-143628]|uniref:hypothetical protein n=1 Tax=Nonomuraea sp. CA-143628 TaxID=3239997 RepID=UPI003D929860
MKMKRGVLVVALTLSALALGSTPAQAIPPPPPGGDLLLVISYFVGDQIVGQRWSGCSQPPGQWGTTDGQAKYYFTPC